MARNEKGRTAGDRATPREIPSTSNLTEFDTLGKAAAIACFCHSILPLSSVQRLFDRHPAWRSA